MRIIDNPPRAGFVHQCCWDGRPTADRRTREVPPKPWWLWFSSLSLSQTGT